MVRQQPLIPFRPIDLDAARDETIREDDEILKQLHSTQARISIWSLLASSTTHKETLIMALSRIRVDTMTLPKGLIHMLIDGRPIALFSLRMTYLGRVQTTLNLCIYQLVVWIVVFHLSSWTMDFP